MFEKEAEEYAGQSCFTEMPNPSLSESIDISDDIKEAVMFGYNKANEWHYNGVPENENDILCQIDKDIFVVGYFHQKNKQYYTISGEWLKTVIAWKEIVLPELPKE